MTDQAKRAEALGRFMGAQADYLRSAGWVPLAPAVVGGPIWWKHPEQKLKMSQANACSKQESVDNDLIYNYNMWNKQTMDKTQAKQLYLDKKGTATQKELAELEHQVWVLHNLSNAGSRPGSKKEWLFSEFGGTRYDYESRAVLLAAGNNVNKLWEKVNTGMPIGTAVRLFRSAKKTASTDKVSLDKAVDKVIQDYDSLGHSAVSADGKAVLKKRAPYAKIAKTNAIDYSDIKQVRQHMHAVIESYVQSLPEGLDPFLLKETVAEFTLWVDEGIDTFKYKLNKLKREDRESALLTIGKTKFNQAVEVIGLKPSDFQFGKPINIKAAKKVYLGRARLLHPDVTGGSENKDKEYIAVTDAFKILEQYAEKFGAKK